MSTKGPPRVSPPSYSSLAASLPLILTLTSMPLTYIPRHSPSSVAGSCCPAHTFAPRVHPRRVTPGSPAPLALPARRSCSLDSPSTPHYLYPLPEYSVHAVDGQVGDQVGEEAGRRRVGQRQRRDETRRAEERGADERRARGAGLSPRHGGSSCVSRANRPSFVSRSSLARFSRSCVDASARLTHPLFHSATFPVQ